MEEPKPQRRPLQFSLRKLMLWTAVWAGYLGVLRLVPMPTNAGVCLTALLGTLLVFRVGWGFERGMAIAVCVTVGIAICLGVAYWVMRGGLDVLGLFVSMAILCLGGVVVSFWGWLFVHAVVVVVDWIDDLMRTKTPPGR